METLIPQHRLLVIKTQPHVLRARGSLYHSVSWAWRINVRRARQADFILGCVQDICRGVFVADEWRQALAENFPHFQNLANRPGFEANRPDRHGFIGTEAPPEICGLYENKLLPEKQQGGQNAIRYINC